jgi:hypothetical protein
MSYCEAFTVLTNSLAPAVGPLLGSLLGFLSGWGLFVLQENRKQAKAAVSTRESLTAELKWLESLLSITTIKCAVQSGMIDRGIEEYRWIMKHAERNTLQEISPEIVKGREKLSSIE